MGPLAYYDWDPALAAQFTVMSRFEDQEPIRLWSRVGDKDGNQYIGLPWHACPPPPDGADRRLTGRPIFVKSQVQLRPQQVEPVADMIARLKAGRSFVMKAPTGSGKTIMALHATAAFGRNVIVVPPKDDLMDQWIERIQQAWGLKPSQIGRVQGDVCDFVGKDIVLGSLRSLYKPNRYPAALYKEFGLLIGDEVHRWGADQMSLICSQFYCAQRLGLTATFDRSDGRDVVVSAHVGEIEVEAKIETLKPKVFRFKSKWVCPRHPRTGDRIAHAPGRIAPIQHSIFSNSHRNRMICHFASTAYKRGRRTVIFSDHLAHLEMLHVMLQRWGVPDQEIGHYYGSTTKKELSIAGSRAVILATYPKMAEGTDIPTLDTLIMAGPRSNVEQAVGRILRLSEGKSQPVVFDIVDTDSPVLIGYAKARDSFYQRAGATVQEAYVPEEELTHAS